MWVAWARVTATTPAWGRVTGPHPLGIPPTDRTPAGGGVCLPSLPRSGYGGPIVSFLLPQGSREPAYVALRDSDLGAAVDAFVDFTRALARRLQVPLGEWGGGQASFSGRTHPGLKNKPGGGGWGARPAVRGPWPVNRDSEEPPKPADCFYEGCIHFPHLGPSG